MKPLPLVTPAGAVLALLCFSGCQTVVSRIQQDPAAFAALEPGQQERVKTGDILVGDTPSMVRLAYGAPDHAESIPISTGGRRTTWTYTKTQYIKEGSRIIATNERTGTGQIEEHYRVFDVLERQVVFIDNRVVHVRDPAREARALAQLR